MSDIGRKDRRRSLGGVKIEVSSTVLTIIMVALSFAAITALWLYAPQTSHTHLIMVFLSLIIVVSVVVFIDQIQKKRQLRRLQLQQIINQRTSELEAAKTAAEAARLQAEQINRQLQAAISHANLMTQQAMESNRSKSEFLAEMSHQIRIPMNAIMGFSEVLADENLTDQQKKQVGIIRESSRQLLQLINDVLDFSKIEAGKLEIDIADCNLESVISSVESLMKPVASEKGLQLEIIRSHPLPESIYTDGARLKQCLMNLVSTAIRFTDKGYVYMRVFWDNSNTKPFVRFDVEYSQADLSPQRQYNTFGRFGAANLGLTVTQCLAELLSGTLTIAGPSPDRIGDRNSILTLTIPTAVSLTTVARRNGIQIPALTKDKEGKRASTLATENLQLSGKILMAEDSRTNQALIELLLRKMGIEVVTVENGRLAVEKAMAEKFDLILMDIQMPVMNGYEATTQLRQNGVKIPIVALTACAMKGDDEKCLAAGCSDYLSKPVDKKRLVDVLTRYLPVAGAQPESSADAQAVVEIQEEKAEIEIDWHLLMERIGSEDLIDEIVPIFTKDNAERIRMLSLAVQKNDVREIKFYAHSIKGAAATIGAAAISQLALQLETAVRDSDASKYKPIFEELRVRFNRLIEFLSRDNWKQMAQQASPSQHTEKT